MRKKTKILIVDDEPEFTTALQSALQDEGFKVLTVFNRTEAQKMAWAERPDMVILGTIAPRGDAFLLHQWLKQTPLFNNLPLIVLNAPQERQLLKGWTREEGIQLDCYDFLTKPVEPAALVLLIQKLMDKSIRRISVLVADDHPIVRDGIRALLSLQKDIQVVGEAVNGRDALEKARHLLPNVVLMDVVMPIMNGLEATRHICKEFEQVKVLMLTQYADNENILASSQAGALGFIPKSSVSSQLLAGIRSVNQGKHFMPAMS